MTTEVLQTEGDPLETYIANVETYTVCDNKKLGETLLQAATMVVRPEKVEKLNELEPYALGLDLKIDINLYNDDLLRAAGFPHGARSDEFGFVSDRHGISLRGEVVPEGLKSLYDPKAVADYLRKRLIYVGALPIPKTDIREIIADLGLEAVSPEDREDEQMEGLLAQLGELTGLRRIDEHEYGMMLSGEGRVRECVGNVVQYALKHRDEIDDMIREIWHGGNVAFNPCFTDEERGGRAKLYASIQKRLIEQGDSHAISISYRSADFVKRVLPALLMIKGYIINLPKTNSAPVN